MRLPRKLFRSPRRWWRPDRGRPPGRGLPAVLTAVVAAAVMVPLAAATGPLPPARAAAAAPDTIANLWMWPFASIGAECTNVLGPKGYGAVQVAPPQNSISVAGHPWWDVYQPVSYSINGRLGNRTQFAAMVQSCRAAGVKVYVDTVINHMTGANQSSSTSYGGESFTNSYRYPVVPYTPEDFHTATADCPNSSNGINNWDNPTEVWNCQLLSLSDLRTGSDRVRDRIAGYLNDLLALGVDGFRVDAAKHIPQTDLAAIKSRLSRQPSYFAQEIYPGSSNPSLTLAGYESTGGVLEFSYASALRNQFTGNIANLQSFGPSWGLRPSGTSTAFVSNHDTERAGSTLSYKSGATDTLATVFMLAWNYGTPNVMSSFTFSNNDSAPPSNSEGDVSAVSCGNGWQCQHRTRAVANMVGFRNETRSDSTVSNWWSDGSNVIAFSRGPAGSASGWVAINNSGNGSAARSFATGLPAGSYCDVVHGDFDAANGTCSGPVVTVGAGGAATVAVGAKDAVAIHAGARVGSTSTSTPTPTNPTPTPTPTPTDGSGQVSATFAVTGAPGSNPVYVVGSVAELGSWAPVSAVPLTQDGATWRGTVALPPSTAVEYKFITRDAAGNVTWETAANRTLTSPANGSTSVNATWNGPASTAPTTSSVAFAVNATTWFGQNVFVVGSVPALGGWSPAGAVPLSAADYPTWTGSVTVPAGTAFEYKYLKKNPDGTVEWETGANRTATVPASGAVTLTGTWRG